MPDEDSVFDHIGSDRRTFVKRAIIGTAFAVPVISSFSLSGLNAVGAQTPSASGTTTTTTSTSTTTTTTTTTTSTEEPVG